MTPADLAQRIAALDWSATSLQHQLAISAACATLIGIEPMTDIKQKLWDDLGAMRAPAPPSGAAWRQTNVDGSCELVEMVDISNVVQIPVRPRTCWTTLCHLDGREWARSSHFGPEGAWGWVQEAVAHEHGVSEDQVGSLEGSSDDPCDLYDGDDLVTIDGLPVYRIQHLCK